MNSLPQHTFKQGDRSDFFDLERMRPAVGAQPIGREWLTAFFTVGWLDRLDRSTASSTPQAARRLTAAASGGEQKVGETTPGLPSPLPELNKTTHTGLRCHVSLAEVSADARSE